VSPMMKFTSLLGSCESMMSWGQVGTIQTDSLLRSGGFDAHQVESIIPVRRRKLTDKRRAANREGWDDPNLNWGGQTWPKSSRS